MKLLPYLDITSDSDNMTPKQSTTIAIIVYISVILYTGLLVLELHNVYRFLYQ